MLVGLVALAPACSILGLGSSHERLDQPDAATVIDASSCYTDTYAACIAGNGQTSAACDPTDQQCLDNCASYATTVCAPTVGAVCGDGVVDESEECDDGNTVDGDGCSSTCTLEGNPPTCFGDASQACISGAIDPTTGTSPGTACDPTDQACYEACNEWAAQHCATNACGNHVVDPGEQCDDGNAVDGDGCSVACLNN